MFSSVIFFGFNNVQQQQVDALDVMDDETVILILWIGLMAAIFWGFRMRFFLSKK